MPPVRKPRPTKAPVRRRRSVAPTDPVDTLIQEVAAKKAEIAVMSHAYDELIAQLLAALEANEETTRTTSDGVHTHRATVVRGERVTIDETVLQKRVGASTWTKISTRSLDKAKLDIAVKDGLVSETDIADAADVKPNKPYVKITTK